ncbi:membrane protein [Clostridium acetobutylicum]|nr:membrane protein [Clostridium acetobutylicum]
MIKLKNLMNKIIKFRYLIAFIIFILCVASDFNFSSLPAWETYVPQNNNISSKALGKVRYIRTDEWFVQTPFYMAQAMNKNHYPVNNNNIGVSGQNMILNYNAPVLDITVLSKPFNWGFLLLGKGYGLSWYWFSKLLLLILLSYEICYIITKGNKTISVLGSLWITFSPAVQWWFMQHIGDLVFYFEAIIVTYYYFLKNLTTKFKKIFFAFAFSLSCIGFTLVIYPAVQVPLFYLGIIFMVILFMNLKKDLTFKISDILIIILSFGFIAFNLIHFYLISEGSLKILLNTAYPGKRVSTGGDLPWYVLNIFLINPFLPFKDSTYKNNCEVSNLYNFFFPLIFCVPFLVKNKLKLKIKDLKFGICLIAFALIQIFFMFFKIPTFLSKITLFSYVTGERLLVVYALTSVYLSIWALALISKKKPFTPIFSLIVSAITTLIYYITIFHSPFRIYVTPIYYYLILAIFFILSFLLVYGKKTYFSIIMAIMIIVTGMTVNPLTKGVNSLYNNNLSKNIISISQSNPSANWISVDNTGGIMGAFIYANGGKCLNGVNFYPDLKKWKLLDPKHRNNLIYNRYSHFSFNLTDKKTSFKLLAPDNIEVILDINDLKKLKVKFILAQSSLDNYANSNVVFDKIYQDRVNNYIIYKVIYK